jgi:hypothetical protein
MSWIVWLPHAASALALLLVVANTNLGRPADPDRSLLFLEVVVPRSRHSRGGRPAPRLTLCAWEQVRSSSSW